VPELAHLFPTFRAHPLLFQSLLAAGFDAGLSESFGRVLAALFGIATVPLVYALGSFMYGRRVGVIAALLVAVMPYEVIVSRQVLLDGPLAFFLTLTLYLMARYAASGRSGWLYATGAGLGLSLLTKEVGILYGAALVAFVALSPDIGVRFRQIIVATVLMVVVVAPYPLASALGGGAHRGGDYLTWQLFRRPNHDLGFYPSILPGAIGPLVLVSALIALIALRRRISWRELLLLCWIFVPALFFELWPVKGYQYLLAAAPAVALLAGRGTEIAGGFLASRVRGEPHRRRTVERFAVAALAATLAITLFLPSFDKVRASASPSASVDSLAGTGGLPRGREAGKWIRANVPQGARILTIGPSMANIVTFYGRREANGLSVSPNPLNRNPSYDPVVNPDRTIRNADLQYLVWDAYSASRSPFFAKTLIRYADRYSGRIVHQETVPARSPSGARVRKPVIVVYEVRP
jgi:hypothetical protein